MNHPRSLVHETLQAWKVSGYTRLDVAQLPDDEVVDVATHMARVGTPVKDQLAGLLALAQSPRCAGPTRIVLRTRLVETCLREAMENKWAVHGEHVATWAAAGVQQLGPLLGPLHQSFSQHNDMWGKLMAEDLARPALMALAHSGALGGDCVWFIHSNAKAPRDVELLLAALPVDAQRKGSLVRMIWEMLPRMSASQVDHTWDVMGRQLMRRATAGWSVARAGDRARLDLMAHRLTAGQRRRIGAMLDDLDSEYSFEETLDRHASGFPADMPNLLAREERDVLARATRAGGQGRGLGRTRRM